MPGNLDESQASKYLGKTILISVTYVNRDGAELGRKQWIGTIRSFSNTEAIGVAVRGSDEHFCLPPVAESIRPAKPGPYQLKSTGEEVVDPDYLATWVCERPE